MLSAAGTSYQVFRLDALDKAGFSGIARLPFSLKILLENLLRCEDGLQVTREDVVALANWRGDQKPTREIAFHPARVLMQDFTGVPAVVDLAAMRDALKRMGGDPARINPLEPADLVIDHSVQVDAFGSTLAFHKNVELEYARNAERYRFLRWGQTAFADFRVVPPGTGICHQVNLEYLSRTVWSAPGKHGGPPRAYPDTLVGTDSHTTMVNGLAVLGWGVGGIEAEAAMLGQPLSMLIPEVVGFRLAGELPEGATATDLVLMVTQMLRKKGVVGRFVEFFGPGISSLNVADRATIANMAPEYGATCGFFPVDDETLAYLRFTNRPASMVELCERYCKEQGLFRTIETRDPVFTDTLELDLSQVEPSLAGPRRPQDRVPLRTSKANFRQALIAMTEGRGGKPVTVEREGACFELSNGSVVIAAITSCTNTSNPAVMLAAGLLARNAVKRGLRTKPWVKTSLAPGSKVVTDYLESAGVTAYLDALGFHLVGYGCTTCIGNSGPLPDTIANAVTESDLVVVSVLSGNRNFEGRINPHVRANYLASPPLVVAYALAGHMDIDFESEPIGHDSTGAPVYLREIWPSARDVTESVRGSVTEEMFRKQYAAVFEGDERWRGLDVPSGALFAWDEQSTYIKHPPYFDGMTVEPVALQDIVQARVLAVLGDSITTDHISPAGSIKKDGPAGKYLIEHGVRPEDFNSYGARRGNHEVMMRGTFANIRLKNKLASGTEGGVTLHLPAGTLMSIYDAAMAYQSEGVPLVVLAGQEYGTGSSRDWAAKGTRLLGVRAVLANSFERIHRSNLVGMGVLPLEFEPGEGASELGLGGREQFTIKGIAEGLSPGKRLVVEARTNDATKVFGVVCRVDTPQEVEYVRHGGILQYVLRKMLAKTLIRG